MKLSPTFVTRTKAVRGVYSEEWLSDLDPKIVRLKKLWHLSNVRLMESNYNLVAWCDSSQFGPSFLKIAIDPQDLSKEWEVLRYFEGKGMVKPHAYEVTEGALLLEQCIPGISLSDYFPARDEEATDHALTLIKTLISQSLEKDQILLAAIPSLKEWFEPLLSSEAPLGTDLKKARLYAQELIEMKNPYVLAHGDLHHENILNHRGQWIGIDPKGVYAPVGFDVGCYLRNPLMQLIAHPRNIMVIGRRLDQCSDRLSLDRSFLVKMNYTQAMLAACWAFSDNEPIWKYFFLCARLIESSR